MEKKRNKKPIQPVPDGQVLPNAKDLESAILGAVMIEKGALDVVMDLLKPEMFYVDAHQKIYGCFLNLQRRNMPIDLLTVAEDLRSTGDLEQAGGAFGLTTHTRTVVSSANILTHCRIVMQKYQARELIKLGYRLIGEGGDPTTNVEDLMNSAEGQLLTITNTAIKKDFIQIGETMPELFERIDKAASSDSEVNGVDTGFPGLNKLTKGWQPTDLIIIAARPSVGKTAFALMLARAAALSKTPVGFFSLEMSATQLAMRMVSADSNIVLERLTSGKIGDDMQLLFKSSDRMLELPMYVDDTAALNIFEFRAKARRMVNKYGVRLIIVDYLQLMRGDSEYKGNREQEISNISRNLKVIAKDLKIPIIALSQLSRAVEARSNRQPQLSDLRESGAIEQDADMVIFLWRPGEDEIEANADLRNKAMSSVAKHRNGALEKYAYEVNYSVQRWRELGALTPSNTIPRMIQDDKPF